MPGPAGWHLPPDARAPGRGRASCVLRAPIAGPSDLHGGQGGWRDRGNDEHDRATTGQDPLMRYAELRRPTGNQGDRLTPRGVADAEMTGREGLHPPYAAFVSAGAARATQMPEILRHAAGQDDTPITAATGLRSPAENRWRDAARAAGQRADPEDIRAIDPDLAERESLLPASVLRQVAEGLPEGGRALAAGHSPASEAAVPGLAGRVVPPPGKGQGVLLAADGGACRVEPPH